MSDIKPLLSITLLSQYINIVLAAVAVSICLLPHANSFDWDLNTSLINIENPLYINFDNSKINATNGFYNIDTNLLKIDNTRFNRKINNSEGVEEYQVEIKSDFAKWFKNDNKLVFTSNEKQVETTIKFLLTK